MLELGQILQDKYRVDRLVGKGGMGQVFEGFHLLIDRRVAIKILLPSVASSEDGAARFEREVRAAARISNDHILDVFDAGSLPDGSRFMVSEFLDGETLETRLRRGALSAKETARLIVELLDGLGAAHRAGITHRDLKPDNIFLTQKAGRDDFVKIIDFGVSKLRSEDPQSVSMTTTGVVLGTPQYLSPEQAQGLRDLDARSDLYTVGVIMYRCVAGRVPFDADSCQALLFKIALEEAQPLTEAVPGLERNFAALVQRAMTKDRGARFQSADEMSLALKRWLNDSPQRAAGKAGVAPSPNRDSPKGDSDTVAAMPAGATSSNVEVSTPRPPFRPGARSVSRAVLVVLGLSLVVALASATFVLGRRLSGTTPNASAQPGADTSPGASTTAKAAPAAPSSDHGSHAAGAVGAEPALAEQETARTAPRGEPSASAPPNASPPDAPAEARPRVTKPKRPPTATEGPAPKPSATARPRRDFGY